MWSPRTKGDDMQETDVLLETGGPVLEGRYRQGSSGGAVAICHPHPLYGGCMDHPVVAALRDGYRRKGYTTLRFNFRGVGKSEGRYGEGIGEVEDLLAAHRYLRLQNHQRVDLAGYSFGAWVVLKACRAGVAAGRLALVSPPVGLLNFDDLRLPAVPTLVVLGDRDEIAPVPAVASWLAAAAPGGEDAAVHRVVLPGCDHFYGGFEAALAEAVARYLAP